MFDHTRDTTDIRHLLECFQALIEAAANNRIEEVQQLATSLCRFDGAGRSIVSAAPIPGRARVGVFFRSPSNPERFPEPTRPREVDIVHFAVWRWMAAPCAPNTGQGFFWHPDTSGGKLRYYLRYGDGTRDPGARVYVTRIIGNALGREAARFAAEHYSYCAADLARVAQRSPQLPPGEYGREQAVMLACKMYAGPDGRNGISESMYEIVLLDLLKCADAFHGVAVLPN